MIILTYKKYKLSHTLEFVDIMSPSLLIYQSENFLSFNLYILYFSKLNDFMPIPFHGLLSLLKHEWLNSNNRGCGSLGYTNYIYLYVN